MNRWALAELIDADLPPEKLERLARVDALLRLVAAADRRQLGRKPCPGHPRSGRPRPDTPA